MKSKQTKGFTQDELDQAVKEAEVSGARDQVPDGWLSGRQVRDRIAELRRPSSVDKLFPIVVRGRPTRKFRVPRGAGRIPYLTMHYWFGRETQADDCRAKAGKGEGRGPELVRRHD